MRYLKILIFPALIFFVSCSLLKEQVDYEKYSKGTEINLKTAEIFNDFFAYSIAIDDNNNPEVKNFSFDVKKVFAASLKGETKEVIRKLKLKIGFDVSNSYPFPFNINHINSDIYTSDNAKLSSIAYNQSLILKENEKKRVDLTIEVPEDLQLNRLINSKTLSLKGTVNVSLIYDGKNLPGIDVPFQKEIELPTDELKNKLESANINLDSI